MNNKDKIILGLTAIQLVGTVVSVWAYGQYKYYDGRISKSKELMPILESLNYELKNSNLKENKA